ncbi:MAG: AAA family ATPase [Xanthobacteraceae bacterium]|nr:AAA family ATPase [Xanthobacteraceae bacterium]
MPDAREVKDIVVKDEETPFDFITILRSEDVAPGKRIVVENGKHRLAEQLEKENAARENRKPAKPPHPTRHTVSTHPLRADHILDDLFAALSEAKGAYAIHGALRDGSKTRNIRRRKALFNDARHAWLALDIDRLACDFADGAAVAAFVRDRLPEEFRNRRCAWNLTPSHILKNGKSRVRLYFALDRSITLAETKSWLLHATIADGLAIDHALWNSRVQENFLRPALDRGVADPFPTRWGILPGDLELVAVPEIDASAVAAKSERRGLPGLPSVTVDDPAYIAYALPRLFAERTVDRIDSDGRQNTFRFLAQDFQDRAFSQDVCEAACLHFYFHSEETADALREALDERGVERAAKLVAEVTALGEARDDVWLGREGTIDESDILSQIHQGYDGAQNGFGCKTLASEDASTDFAAVDDEDDDAAQSAFDLWLAEPSDLARYETLVSDLTSRGIKRSAASRAIRDAQLGALMGVDEAGVAALRELATAPKKPRASAIRQLTLADAIESASSFRNAYVVKGLLDLDAVNLLYAATNVGKTFAAVHISGCVAGGKKCFGRRVKQGPVVYLAAEGLAGIKRRFAAMSKQLDIASDAPITIVPQAVNLLSKEGGPAFADLCREKRPVLIVVDTVHVAMGGVEENNEMFGKLVVYCKALIELTGAAVLLIHHEGKNSAAGSRGGSALISDVDNAFRLSRSETQAGLLHLSGAKLKEESKDGFGIGLSLRRVVLGTDEDGDEVSTCVVEEGGDTGEAFGAVTASPSTANAAAVLRAIEALTGGDRKRAVTTAAVEAQLAELGRDKVKRGLARLAEADCVVRAGRGEWRLAESEAHELPGDE